jgi:hypothetical protein
MVGAIPARRVIRMRRDADSFPVWSKLGLNLWLLSSDIRDEMSLPDRPSRTQDEWIVLRCQSGDNTGFEDLVALMERPLLYYAAKLTGNAQTAHDALRVG